MDQLLRDRKHQQSRGVTGPEEDGTRPTSVRTVAMDAPFPSNPESSEENTLAEASLAADEFEREALGHMTRRLAHDFNQPIAVARMSAENTLFELEDSESVPAPDLAHRMRVVALQAEHLAGLVDQFRLITDMTWTPNGPFDAAHAVGEVTGMVASKMSARGFDIDLRVGDTACPVLGQSCQFKKALLVVIWHMLDVLEEDVGTAADAKRLVRFELRMGDGEKPRTIALEVTAPMAVVTANRGRNAPRVSSAAREVTFASYIMQRLNGSLEHVENNATFCYRFNLATSKGRTAEPVTPHANGPGRDAADTVEIFPLRILVVDDETLALEGIREHLERGGHGIETARNGKDALALLESTSFDIVLTDLRMPVMDGNALIRAVQDRNPDMPIIVMTGHTQPELERQALDDGALMVLRKPLRLRQLTTILRRVVAQNAPHLSG